MEEETHEQTLIEQANQAAERLEQANKAMAELVKRQEEIEARRVLGGQSSAGQAKEPEKTQEQINKEGALQYFKGTALERLLK